MPYKLIYISNEDKKTEIKPLSCDNPNSEFGFERNSGAFSLALAAS